MRLCKNLNLTFKKKRCGIKRSALKDVEVVVAAVEGYNRKWQQVHLRMLPKKTVFVRGRFCD